MTNVQQRTNIQTTNKQTRQTNSRQTIQPTDWLSAGNRPLSDKLIIMKPTCKSYTGKLFNLNILDQELTVPKKNLLDIVVFMFNNFELSKIKSGLLTTIKKRQ